ncbi:MAG: DUF2786 domain-containing protein [Magnetococcales bacterium]|nr:DUF2786 domain-containing protein [Magnetococcales bacterium]
MERRATVSVSGDCNPLTAIAEIIDLDVAEGNASPLVSSIFQDLRRQVRFASPIREKKENVDLDKVLVLIQKLREKTVDRGCTEEEALVAASKVAELLDRYGLSLSEVELTNTSNGDRESSKDNRSQFWPPSNASWAHPQFNTPSLSN